MKEHKSKNQSFGSTDLSLPKDLRGPLQAHLRSLREAYLLRGWAGRVGFGARPAVVVIDLAKYWLDPKLQIGSQLDVIVDATCEVLKAARQSVSPSSSRPSLTTRPTRPARTIKN